MTRKNRHYGHSKINKAKFRQIVRRLALDFMAISTTKLTEISARSVSSIYLMRRRIAESCELDSPLQNTVEVDELHFGANRIRSKSGRSTYGKTIVFCLLKRQGKAYTKAMPDCSKATLQGIIWGHVASRLSAEGANGACKRSLQAVRTERRVR